MYVQRVEQCACDEIEWGFSVEGWLQGGVSAEKEKSPTEYRGSGRGCIKEGPRMAVTLAQKGNPKTRATPSNFVAIETN